ncbi:MAG: hypothetical protein GKS03_09705 [Alphaproteobacteria bacterium]|nr:hypothetical protein [Alphaproteobacteria bacterium]
MSQTFFVLGSIPFIVLGFAHGVYTWIERTRPFRLTPHKPEVREAMQGSTMVIHPSTNMWRGWLGFNFSHSLGAVVFGLIYLVLATSDFAVIAANPVLLWLPIVTSGLFVVLAWHYWFIIPLVGISIGFGCFVAGVGMVMVG